MKFHRQIINRCFTISYGRLSRPISNTYVNRSASMALRCCPTVSIRFLSNKTHQPSDQNNTAPSDPEVDITTEIDISSFTEEVPILLPDLGESTGKVIKWHKKEGDIIRHGDTLCDIETELFTFGMEIDDECLGILDKIVARADEKLMPHALLCVVLHKPE